MKKQDKIEISVIIPTYKPQKYIEKCLNSILNQIITVKIEVLIILNGPCSPYKEKLSSLLKRRKYDFLKVHLYYLEDAGVSAARNYGIDKAKGNYITFIDDDDYVSPRYLEDMFSIAITGRMPIANLMTFDDGEREFNSIYLTEMFEKKKDKEIVGINEVRSFFSMPVCKLISKEIIDDRRFNTNYSNGEDALFMALISDNIQQIKLTSPDCLYFRRVRDNSLTTRKRSRLDRVMNHYNLIISYFSFWFKRPLDYNFIFLTTRILANIKGVFLKY